MFKQILLCLIALAPFSTPAHGGLVDMVSTLFTRQLAPQPPAVKVLIAHDEPKVLVEVTGKYHLFDPRNGAHIESHYKGKRRYAEAFGDGIRWGEEFAGVHQIMIVPENSEVTTVVNGVEYRGNVYIYDVGGTISVVNGVDLEDYLMATLPERFPHVLPTEQLAAIAIVARTQGLYLIDAPKNPYWDADAERVGYRGWIINNRSKALEKAIRETRYMVLQPSDKGEWTKTPFSLAWRPANGTKVEKGTTYSMISFEQATKLAERGDTAVQILKQAFPNTSIQLIYESKS